MIADTALVWTECIVVLHTEPLENPGRTIIHLHRDGNLNLPLRLHEDVDNTLIKLEDLCTVQKLLLGHFKRVYLRHGFCFLSYCDPP